MFDDAPMNRAVVTAYGLAMESVGDGYAVALIPCVSTTGRSVVWMRRHKLEKDTIERRVMFHRNGKVRTSAMVGLCVGAHLRLQREVA